MRQLLLIVAAMICIAAPASAQRRVAVNTALQLAIEDINERLGTAYEWDSGDVAFLYEETRVEGNNLGCPVVAATDNATYTVMTVQFDTEIDNIYEWEYRFAYDADGNLLMVICDTPPGGTRGPGPVGSPAPTNTPTPTDTPTPTPTNTPTPPPIQIGRDGPRVLPPLICGGLPTRLIVGSTGRVIIGGLSNNARQAPDLDAPVVNDLFEGTQFTVVDGPFCIDDIAWYAVEVDGVLMGWTAEGENLDYYIEPVLTDAARILPANAAMLAPAGVAFAPGTLGMTAPHAGAFVAWDADSAQLWVLPQDIFTPLELSQWQPLGNEIVGQFSFAHRDFTGRAWTADALNGTLQAVDVSGSSPFALAPSVAPVVAIDTESAFIAVPAAVPNGVSVFGVNDAGGGNTEVATFSLSGAVRDLAFRPDEAGLYVATDSEIALFAYSETAGWNPTPVTIFTHDLLNPQLSVSLSGATVAVTGMSTGAIPGLRVYNVDTEGTVSVVQGAAVNGEPNTSWSRPSISPDGSLVAIATAQGTVRIYDTAAGALLNELVTGGFGPVAFSTDGLVLIAGTANQNLQVYGVAIEPEATATPTLSSLVVVTATPTFGPVVITATPTFGPIVVTATPTVGPIVVTATPTTAPTLPPTLSVPPTSEPTATP